MFGLWTEDKDGEQTKPSYTQSHEQERLTQLGTQQIGKKWLQRAIFNYGQLVKKKKKSEGRLTKFLFSQENVTYRIKVKLSVQSLSVS